MARMTFDEAVEFLKNQGLDVRGYSGRGMYGAECPGVEFDSMNDALAGMLDIGYALADEGHNPGVLSRVELDDMGTGVIAYWPRLTKAKSAT